MIENLYDYYHFTCDDFSNFRLYKVHIPIKNKQKIYFIVIRQKRQVTFVACLFSCVLRIQSILNTSKALRTPAICCFPRQFIFRKIREFDSKKICFVILHSRCSRKMYTFHKEVINYTEKNISILKKCAVLQKKCAVLHFA